MSSRPDSVPRAHSSPGPPPIDWVTLCRQLEGRAQRLDLPVDVARQHFQCGEVLRLELGRDEAAEQAYRQAIRVCPTYIPAFLALREMAIELDDETLAGLLFDHALTYVEDEARRTLVESRDRAEIFQCFLLLWTFRWREPDRASRALDVLGADASCGLAPRAEHFFAGRERRVEHLGAWMEEAKGELRTIIAATLGRMVLDGGGRPELGRQILAEAARADLSARWRLIEDAARGARADSLADQLEAAAAQMSPTLGAALRFIAGEVTEYRLADLPRAQTLYRGARRGRLQSVVSIKRVVADAWGARAERDASLADTLARAADGIGELEGVFWLRAGELWLGVGDAEAAERAIRLAMSQEADERHARALLEKMYWDARRWPELVTVLRAARRLDRNQRVLLSAVCEHAIGEPEAAAEALLARRPGGPSRRGERAHEIPPDDLLVLRTLFRVVGRTETSARIRVLRDEADAHEDSERRCDLYLKLGRLALRAPEEHERAMAALYWVLDFDPENLTALRLIEYLCRANRDERSLAEILARQLPLIQHTEERYRLKRELARWWEGAGDDPSRALDFYRGALDERPDDDETLADLDRLFGALERYDEQRRLLDRRIDATSDASDRAQLLVRLGEIHERRLGDRAEAQRHYENALTLVTDADAEVETAVREQVALAMARIRAPVTAASAVHGVRDETWSHDNLGTVVTGSLTRNPTGVTAHSGIYSQGAAGGATAEYDVSQTVLDAEPITGSGVDGDFEAILARLATESISDAPDTGDSIAGSPRVKSLPPLQPIQPIQLSAFGADETTTHEVPIAPLLGPRQSPVPVALGPTLDAMPAGPASIPDGSTPMLTPPSMAAVDLQASAFLGKERQPDRHGDRGRAIIEAKLRRSRAQREADVWPAHGDRAVAESIAALSEASDLDARVSSLYALATLYETGQHFGDAIRAYQTVLGYSAGERRAVDRLLELCRGVGDWRGLADILARSASQTGDPERRRELLLEVARLEAGPLNNPGGAAPLYREALKLAPRDPEVVRALADTLKAVRRWEEYAEVLAIHGLGGEDSAEQDLELGRVYLYHLESPEKAAHFIERAARAFGDRVDVIADLAAVKAATGDVDRAVRLLERAIRNSPKQTRGALHLRLGRLLEAHREDAAGARDAYRDAIRHGVRDAALLDRLEHLAEVAEDWETVAFVLQRQLADADARELTNEERHRLAVRLGHVYAKQLGRPQDAGRALAEAYVAQPRDFAVFRLVDALLTEHPSAEWQTRIYETFLAQARPTPQDRAAVGLKLALVYELAKRIDDAITALEEVDQLDPDNPDVLTALERVYRRGERWPELVTLYRKGLDKARSADNRLILLRRLAQALEVGLRDLPSSVDVYREVLTLAPGDLPTVRALGRLLEATRRWDELLELSEREMELIDDPRQKAYVWFRMGSIHETHLGDLEAAERAYERVLHLDPKCFPALHGLRELAAAAHDWPRVAAHLEREVPLWDKPKERAAVLARLGELYEQRLGETHTAIDFYSRAIDTYAACVPAARALADHAFRAERWADAMPFFQIVCNQNLDKWARLDRCDLFYRRGVVAMALGRVHEAAESLEIALEFDETHALALEALVRARAELGGDEPLRELGARLDHLDERFAREQVVERRAHIATLRGALAEAELAFDTAASQYTRAAVMVPDDLETLRPLIGLHLKRRHWSLATDALRQFAERQAKVLRDADARERYIDALLLEGDIACDYAVDPEGAATCYRRILDVDPGFREAHFRMAQCAFIRGAFDEARRTMVALLELCHAADASSGERARYTFYLGRIHQLGFRRLDEAERHFRTALELDGHYAPALLALLQVLWHEGKRGDAERLARQYHTLITERGEGDEVDQAPAKAALATLVARIHLERGDAESALGLLSELAGGKGPGSRDARFALARVRAQRGEFDAAAAELYEAVDRDVCDVVALRTLAGLFEEQDLDEPLFHVLSVLELFRALGDDEAVRLRALQERVRHAFERVARPIADDLLDAHLVHPAWKSPLTQLLGVCPPAFRRYGAELDGAPPDAAERITARSRHPLAFDLKVCHAVLGFRGFELYLEPAHAEPVRVDPGEPPRILMNAETAEPPWTQPHRRFVLGRAAAHCRTGLARLHDQDPERTLDMLSALERLFGAADADRDDVQSNTLLDALPRKNVDAIRHMVDAESQFTLPAHYTGESVLVGINRTFDRMGLLACGHLRPSVHCVARLLSDVRTSMAPGADLTWMVRSHTRLQDLVKYAVSAPYHTLRRSIGLAI